LKDARPLNFVPRKRGVLDFSQVRDHWRSRVPSGLDLFAILLTSATSARLPHHRSHLLSGTGWADLKRRVDLGNAWS
jgi:hypothetical protein